MSDTTLNLGDFQFAGLEIPAQISGIGAMQSLAVRKLVGGDREIHSMGQDFRPLEWSGLFFGANAMDRMNALKALTVSGLPQILLWHSFSYLVVILDFSADERRQFEIPYRISCEVVSDNTNPAVSGTSTTTDDALNEDLASAQTLTASVNDPTLTGQMALVSSAMAEVPTFNAAVPSIVASVLQPLQAAQGRVTVLISISDTTLGSQPGFGGVVVGGTAQSIALALEETQEAAVEEMELLNLIAILGRMAANLNSINGSPNTLATAGGNLFQIAALEYGNAMDWTAIATANNLTDPFIDGTTVLTIPLIPGDSDGILSN